MEAEQSTFGDNSFDVVLCALGLMYVPDPERAIRDFHRVLRPGGAPYVPFGVSGANVAGQKFSPSSMRAFIRRFVQCSFALAQRRTCSMHSGLPGLATSSRADLRRASNTPRSDEACDAAFVGGPVALAYSHFSPDTKSEARKEYLESLKAYRIGDHYSIPGEFVVVAGTK